MPDLSREVRDSADAIESLVPEWDAAIRRGGGSLYTTPEWVLSLWESHHARRDVRFVVFRRGAEWIGVLPLTRGRIRKVGLPFEQIGLVTNGYGQNHHELACIGSVRDALDSTLSLLDPEGWDILFVGSVPVGSETEAALRGLGTSGRGRLVVEPYVASPFLPLDGDWDGFLRSRSANFRSDMKRKWSKARSAGLEFRVVRDAGGLGEALRVILDIETRSWKENAGTSISVQRTATRFYEIFLPRAAARGWLYIVLLEIGGRPAAYDMGILHGGKYYMLKTSFDQSFSALSPGVVLRQWVVRKLCEMQVAEHDFLGDADPYKLRWTDSSRGHSNLYLYNSRSWRARAYAAARGLGR